MRKVASILFLLILVFNFWGYRLVLSYLENAATTRLVQRLDAGDYDKSQLVEVKIPLSLPYYTNWGDYESFSGSVNLNGENYQYVKRKVSGDTLYLQVIPHTEKNTIQTARIDYFKIVNDLQHDGTQKQGQQPTTIKLMLSEFLENNQQFAFGSFENTTSSFNLYHRDLISQFDPLTPAQPPEA
ncbi:MAG TPA: hypothetical protein VFS36_08875 [Chitinophagaceae bacterium]|nr:hypothetical protein [Chitinophagaceae bacterium]